MYNDTPTQKAENVDKQENTAFQRKFLYKNTYLRAEYWTLW